MTANNSNEVLATTVNHLKDQVDKQEEEIGKIKEDVGLLKQNTSEMKVYISQIFTMLDDIKLQVNLLNQQGINNQQKNDNQWMDFFQKIVYLVLGGLVAYFFAKMK